MPLAIIRRSEAGVDISSGGVSLHCIRACPADNRSPSWYLHLCRELLSPAGARIGARYTLDWDGCPSDFGHAHSDEAERD